MVKYAYSLVLAILFCACSETPEQPKETKSKVHIVKQKKEPEKDIKPKKIPITNKNVVAKLTQYGQENLESIADIYTTKGKIRIQLYTSTPLHRANFIMMAKSGYYSGTVFTRVRKGFIAQGGGAYSMENTRIRGSIGKYTIPAEFSKRIFHKQGAVGAARRYVDNPNKRSDQSAFYFVEGTPFNEPTLNEYETINQYHYSEEQRTYYLNNPGAAHIDGEHTVFGEILDGFSVVQEITSVRTDSKDWPRKDIFIDSVVVVR